MCVYKAYFGAEVLHPISMQPAIRSQIPVRVKNSYNPKAPGTTITGTRDKGNSLVTAITAKSSVMLVDIVSYFFSTSFFLIYYYY